MQHTNDTNRPLYLARHVVGFCLVAIVSPVVWVIGWSQWTNLVLVAMVGGMVAAGLAALFFTKTQGKTWHSNFAKAGWLFLLLALINDWRAEWSKNAVSVSPPVFAAMETEVAAVEPQAAQQEVSPPAEPPQQEHRGEEQAVREHYARIYAVHPDAMEIVQSMHFQQWLSTRPGNRRHIESGTSDEVNLTLSAYKASLIPPPPAPPKPRLDEQYQINQAAEALARQHGQSAP